MVALEAGALAAVSALVFTRGVLFGVPWSGAADDNLEGVVYYAGGDRMAARRLFEASARRNWHLGFENLAAMAFEDGQPQRALELLDQAAQWQRRETFGTKADAEQFVNITQAEYRNSAAVILHSMGSAEKALAVARSAVDLSPDFPEPHYNLGILQLLAAARDGGVAGEPPMNRKLIEEASRHLADALDLDPGFLPAAGSLGVARALLGDCDAAVPLLRRALP